MIPNFFVEIESFEFLTSGKVDKKKLPPPKAFEQISTPKIFDNPILEIIQQLFPGQEIDKNADFLTI